MPSDVMQCIIVHLYIPHFFITAPQLGLQARTGSSVYFQNQA